MILDDFFLFPEEDEDDPGVWNTFSLSLINFSSFSFKASYCLESSSSLLYTFYSFSSEPPKLKPFAWLKGG